MNNILILLQLKLKIFLRNYFGKKKWIKSWIVSLIAVVLFSGYLYYHNTVLAFIILCSMLSSVLTLHGIDDNSWIDSLNIYGNIGDSKTAIWCNYISDFLWKIGFTVPLILIVDVNSLVLWVLWLLQFLCYNSFNFFMAELMYRFKIARKFYVVSYLFIIMPISTTFGAPSLSTFLAKYNFQVLLYTIGYSVILFLLCFFFYLKYYNIIKENEDFA